MTTAIEKISARRSFLMMFMASAFLIWQVPGMDFIDRLVGGNMRVVDGVALIGALLWIIALLALFWTHRRYRQLSDSQNAALEDELVQDNRRKAISIGYWAMLLVAAVMFVAGLYFPVKGVEAAHMVILAGVAIPLYSFAYLERRHG